MPATFLNREETGNRFGGRGNLGTEPLSRPMPQENSCALPNGNHPARVSIPLVVRPGRPQEQVLEAVHDQMTTGPKAHPILPLDPVYKRNTQQDCCRNKNRVDLFDYECLGQVPVFRQLMHPTDLDD